MNRPLLLLLIALLWSFGGCYPDPPSAVNDDDSAGDDDDTAPVDSDGDGVFGDQDCDDNDAQITTCLACQGSYIVDASDTAQDLEDLRLCGSISGSLTVRNSTLTNLVGLENLTDVGGEVEIRDNNSLLNLQGLENLTQIHTNLIIDANNSLLDLNGLSSLNELGDDLHIANNPQLNSVRGLAQIANVEALVLSNNGVLPDLRGFESLAEVAATLTISGNNNLSDLDELSALESIGGSLSITGNDRLTSLAGLSTLQSIAGDELTISDNPDLASIAGLEGVTELGQALPAPPARITISDNPDLTHLDGMPSLSSLEGTLTISNNDSLTDISGVENIVTLSGPVVISGNLELNNLHGLITSPSGSAVQLYLDSLTVSDNDALTNLNGLQDLVNIGGATPPMTPDTKLLSIDGNPSLSSLAALSNLENIWGNLVIRDNDVLSSTSGLSSLERVQTIEITDNETLEDINGFHGVGSIWFNGATNPNTATDGNLKISRNPGLRNLGGLTFLTHVDGDVIIDDNASLPVLDDGVFSSPGLGGLGSLQTVGGDLVISNNHMLADLTGLGRLSDVGQELRIHNNNGLHSLMGLGEADMTGGMGGLTLQTTDLTITNNLILQYIDVLNYLSSGAVTGTLQISNNPQLCETDVMMAVGACSCTSAISGNGTANPMCF